MGDKRMPFLLQNQVGDLWMKIKDVDDYCKREVMLIKYYYDVINLFEFYLEKNGSVFFSFFNDCVNTFTMEIYFILSTIFERIVIINIRYVYCFNFLGISRKFSANSCVDFDGRKKLEAKIGQFLLTYYNEYRKCAKLFMKEEYDHYIDSYITLNSEFILKYINSQKYLELQIRTTKRLFYDSDKIVRVNSNINYKEGEFLKKVIIKHKCFKCLEVGFAFGISSNFILSTSDKITLVSIDPFQGSQWNDYGLKILRHNGLIDRHRLIREKSYEALPELLKKEKGGFDFIFIDGFHTFDYTLLDIFYSLQLLKKNGVIVIDDVMHSGVSKVVKYVDANYSSFLKKIFMGDIRTFCAYIKKKEDDRQWNFHANF
jgi:predicted O-methyltransferase YrrM